jgi:hypothetical protein
MGKWVSAPPAGTRAVSGISCGVHIKGNLPTEFSAYLFPVPEGGGGEPELPLRVTFEEIVQLPEENAKWSRDYGEAEAKSRLVMFEHPSGFGLSIQCQGSGLFRFTAEGIAIEWIPGGTGPAHYFFNHALPLWLETRGIPVLHASAAVMSDQVVALLGPSGMGKSTLCASLVHTGWRFLTDDGLSLHEDPASNWRCLSGPPMFRLWPGSLEKLEHETWRDLSRVHADFEKRAVPVATSGVVKREGAPTLSAIFILERLETSCGDIVISDYSGGEALIGLIEHTLLASVASALGLAPQRMQQLSRLVERVTVRGLTYPSGKANWPRIEEVIRSASFL